jgi:3-dehydroquinate dehydratase / shikimate dehydrogenase
MHAAARCSPKVAAGTGCSICSTTSLVAASDRSSHGGVAALRGSDSSRFRLARSSTSSTALPASQNPPKLRRIAAMAEQQPSSSSSLSAAAATSTPPQSSSPPPRPPFALPLDAEVDVTRSTKTLLCTSVTAETLEKALEEVKVRGRDSMESSANAKAKVVRRHLFRPPRPLLSFFLFAAPLPSSRQKKRSSQNNIITKTPLHKKNPHSQEAAAAGATCIELRLDCLSDLDPISPDAHLRSLLNAVQVENKLPAIVTFRPKWEGGRYEGEEAPRLAALKWASLLGARFVDVEVLASPYFFAASTKIPVPLTTSIILSHHDYEKTPDFETLRRMVEGMFEAGADVAKIATTATRDGDAAVVLSLAAATKTGPCIALAMGEKGLTSRILAPKYGSFLTFGALGRGRASAPGQPSLRDLVFTFRLAQQSARTRVLGVIGNPVSHSRSPALHNAAIAAMGEAIDAVYLPFLVDDLSSFLAAFDEGDYRGFSVTIPHKLSALENASSADPLAASIGAANTLVRDPETGKLRAFNTDAPAAIGAIEEGLRKRSRERGGGESSSSDSSESPLKGKTVVVLGAGGAGRALAFGAAAAGASTVVIANRDESKAKALCADLKKSFEGLRSEGVSLAALVAKMGSPMKVSVVANSTSVGMSKKGQPSTESPLKTKLLTQAEAAGCGLVSGLEMFVGQAALQFELFFPGQRAPLELMREAVLESVRREEEEG